MKGGIFFLLILCWSTFYCSHFIDEKVTSEGSNNSSKVSCQFKQVLIILHWPLHLHLPSSTLLFAQKTDLPTWAPLLTGFLLDWPIRVFILHSPNLPMPSSLLTGSQFEQRLYSVSHSSYNALSFCFFGFRDGNSFCLLRWQRSSPWSNPDPASLNPLLN